MHAKVVPFLRALAAFGVDFFQSVKLSSQLLDSLISLLRVRAELIDLGVKRQDQIRGLFEWTIRESFHDLAESRRSMLPIRGWTKRIPQAQAEQSLIALSSTRIQPKVILILPAGFVIASRVESTVGFFQSGSCGTGRRSWRTGRRRRRKPGSRHVLVTGRQC